MTKQQIRVNIKTNAKKILQENKNYWRVFAVCVLLFFLNAALSAFWSKVFELMGFPTLLYKSYGALILSSSEKTMLVFMNIVTAATNLLILQPLFVGAYEYLYLMAERRPEGFSTVFGYFDSTKRYKKSVALAFSLRIRQFAYGMLLGGIPILGISVALFMGFAMGQGYNSLRDFFVSVPIENMVIMFAISPYNFLLFLVIFAVVIALSIFLFRYALVWRVFMSEGEMSSKEIIKRSISIMKGHKVEMFWFYFSFFLIYLALAILIGFVEAIVPIPQLAAFLLLVIPAICAPYIAMSLVMFQNYLYDDATMRKEARYAGYDSLGGVSEQDYGGPVPKGDSRSEYPGGDGAPIRDVDSDFNARYGFGGGNPPGILDDPPQPEEFRTEDDFGGSEGGYGFGFQSRGEEDEADPE